MDNTKNLYQKIFNEDKKMFDVLFKTFLVLQYFEETKIDKEKMYSDPAYVANKVNNTLIITAPIQPIIMAFNFCLSGSLLHAIAIKIALSPLKIKSNNKILPRAANHAAENMPSTYSSLLSKLICIILMI